MKAICLTLLILLCAPLMADQSDFARGLVLDASDQSVVQRLTVPDDVYEWVTRSDLGDLRVFNRDQEEMPYNVRRPQRLEEYSAWLKLPLFSLPQRADGGVADPRLRVEVGESGAIINYSGGAPGENPAGAFLIDTSALTFIPAELKLHWQGAESGDFMGRIRIDSSDDLDSWKSLVDGATVARLVSREQSVHLDRIELPPRKARYLRITRLEGSEPILIDQVEARHRRAEMPQRRWRSLAGVATDGGWEFSSGGWFPVDRLGLSDAGGSNFLVTAQLFSRVDAKAHWRDRGERTFYRSTVAGQAVVSEPLAIDDGDRYWRLEFEGTGINSPVLKVGWLPDEVVFVKQGAAPYVLAYGQADVLARQWPLSDVLRQLNGGSGPVPLARIPFAVPGDPQMLGGSDRLVAAPEPVDWQTVILWAVLVLGVLLVGTLAYRLLKN